MFKKKMRYCIALSLVLMLFAAKGVTVLASGGTIQPRYSQTTSISSILTIKSGTAYVTGTVNGIVGRTTKINGFIYLQKKVGSSWNNIITWTDTTNEWALCMNGEKQNLSSGTYRAKFVAYVYEGTSVEEVEMISSEKIY